MNSKEAIDAFFVERCEVMHRICQKADHPLYKAISALNEILIKQNALLEEKVDHIKKMRKLFAQRISDTGNEVNKKLAALHAQIISANESENKRHSLIVSPLKPLNFEKYLLEPLVELSDTDKKKIERAAEKIKFQLGKICQLANNLISSSNKHARLGTMKHRYCQSILEGIQQTGKFIGINSLCIEKSFKGQTLLDDEQRPDVYWEQGGVVFDYKFGEQNISEKDKSISSQILPHYTESHQVNS